MAHGRSLGLSPRAPRTPWGTVRLPRPPCLCLFIDNKAPVPAWTGKPPKAVGTKSRAGTVQTLVGAAQG